MLLDKAGLDTIVSTLLDLPEKIAEAKRTCEGTRQALAGAAEELKTLEARLRADIAEAEDASGKPMFSNEVRREAEFSRRVAKDDRHRGLKEEIAALKRELAGQEIELTLLIDKFSAYRHLARLAAALYEAVS